MPGNRLAFVLSIAGLLCTSGIVLAQNAPNAITAPAQKTIGTSKPEMVPSLIVMNARGASLQGHVWTAPAVQGKNRTIQRNVRVQPCIRPLNAAALAAGPDVIR